MKNLVGSVLNDRYSIVEIVGIGGMAVVYKAVDNLENRFVAVKILKDEFVKDERFRRRFLNESRAIAMLSHKNIVDVYDVNFEGDIQYIVIGVVIIVSVTIDVMRGKLEAKARKMAAAE